VSVWFRAALFLMALGRYGFGDHVTDPMAFVLRAQKVAAVDHAWGLELRQDREVPPCED